ncbi:hypothetical protein JB92DRAFT_2852719 [Gautieria morchelliformis]|nr:hypothetical protein JB92DRAFT_2852719 [Gautieria morchelliformis]
MPVRSSTIQVLTHRTASGFLNAAWPWLSKRESTANTIFPYALKVVSLERAIRATPGRVEKEVLKPHDGSQVHSNIASVSPRIPRDGHSDGYLWFTCWSKNEGRAPYLDIILSCTDGSFGPQPIFLWSSSTPSQTTREHLDHQIVMLVECLAATVPVTRVFSVFGPTSLTKNFSRRWSHINRVTQMVEPLYAARLLYTTRDTLAECLPLPPGDCIRPGSPHDTLTIGELCKEFSETSVYYPLSYDEAIREATELILNHQVWVYETDGGQIATMVAVARVSPNVATVTKVYTCVVRRRRGCAERLLTKVVWEMLHTLGKQRVVLYVGNRNPAAKVYSRVGFVGDEREDREEEVEEWLEVGFRGTCRGHW